MIRHISLSLAIIAWSLSLSAQKIGLLTHSPQAPVHISNSGQVNTPGGFVVLGDTSEAHLEMDFDILQSAYGASPLDLRLQPYGGDVGINTSVPIAPLHVHSSGQVNGPNGVIYLGEPTEGHMKIDFDLLQSGYGVASPLSLKLQPEGGNVGINTYLPAAVLHVANDGVTLPTEGLAVFGHPDLGHLEVNPNGLRARYGGSPHALVLNSGGGDVSLAGGDVFIDYIDNSVGINDNTPSYNLDVNGSIGASQFIYHKEDNDTYFNFTEDRFQTYVGGVQMLDVTEGIQDYMKFGNGSNINVNVNDGLYISGLNKQIGIGSSFTLPTSRLHVKGGADESALNIQSDNRRILESETDRDIVIGSLGDPEEPLVYSYFPMNIWSTVSEAAATLLGPSLQNQAPLLSGGMLNIGDYGTVMLLDEDEIQCYETFEDENRTLKLNRRGGNVIFGNNYNSRIGVNTVNDPVSDLHVFQTATAGTSSAGIRLESPNFDYWRMAVNNSDHLEFYYNGTLKATLSSATGLWSAPSDSTLKKNIRTLGPVLHKVNQLRPVAYHMTEQDETEPVTLGFIAQEIQPLFPGLVTEHNGKLTMNYDQFAVLAIQAINELSEEKMELNQKVTELENRLLRLEAMMTASVPQTGGK